MAGWVGERPVGVGSVSTGGPGISSYAMRRMPCEECCAYYSRGLSVACSLGTCRVCNQVACMRTSHPSSHPSSYPSSYPSSHSSSHPSSHLSSQRPSVPPIIPACQHKRWERNRRLVSSANAYTLPDHTGPPLLPPHGSVLPIALLIL